MKERMRRSEMNRVRASILGKREIEELRQIPDNLRLAEPKTKGGREIRKVVKKRDRTVKNHIKYNSPKQVTLT